MFLPEIIYGFVPQLPQPVLAFGSSLELIALNVFTLEAVDSVGIKLVKIIQLLSFTLKKHAKI